MMFCSYKHQISLKFEISGISDINGKVDFQ